MSTTAKQSADVHEEYNHDFCASVSRKFTDHEFHVAMQNMHDLYKNLKDRDINHSGSDIARMIISKQDQKEFAKKTRRVESALDLIIFGSFYATLSAVFLLTLPVTYAAPVVAGIGLVLFYRIRRNMLKDNIRYRLFGNYTAAHNYLGNYEQNCLG